MTYIFAISGTVWLVFGHLLYGYAKSEAAYTEK